MAEKSLFVRQYKVEIINPSQRISQKGGLYNLASVNIDAFKTRVISSIGQADPLRILFKIVAGQSTPVATSEGAGQMDLAVFNLADTTIADIMVKDSFIRLSVGYGNNIDEEDLDQIFYGKIKNAITGYGPEGKRTSIIAVAGDILNYLPISVKTQSSLVTHADKIEWMLNIIRQKSGNQVAVADAIKTLRAMELADEGTSGIYLSNEIRGTSTYAGSASTVIGVLLRPFRIGWSMVDDRIILTRRGFIEPKKPYIRLTDESGMLTIPKTAIDDDNQIDPKAPVDYTHRILIDPDIKPGSLILTEDLIDETGQRVKEEIKQSVQKITITGDYEGVPWFMDLSATRTDTAFYDNKSNNSVQQLTEKLNTQGGG